MDEETFVIMYCMLIAFSTGTVMGITIASTIWASPILILSYIILTILYGLLLFAAYMQWRENRG